MGRVVKRYQLKNMSKTPVHVVINFTGSGFDVPANATVEDPDKEEWDTLEIDYAVTVGSTKDAKVEYLCIQGRQDIESVTTGDLVTLIYPPRYPAVPNPRGPAPEAEFEYFTKHPRNSNEQRPPN